MNKKFKILFELFLCFFKIGAFTFGGGYAMIPLIQAETVENKKWITDEDILDIVAIAESTPGPIAINTATFVGQKVAGVLGSVAATLGIVAPSFIIIYIISFFLRQFEEIKAVKYAFEGIRAGVLALIVKAVISMYKQSPKGIVAYVIMLSAFIIPAFLNVSVIYALIGAGLVGLFTFLYNERRKTP